MRWLSAESRAGLRIFSAVLGLGILGGGMAPAEGAEPVTHHQVITLWPGGAPGAKGNDPEQDIPTLTVWLAKPETATGPNLAFQEWPKLCAIWLKGQGFLDRTGGHASQAAP